ncbi:MAG: NADH:ubiquinone reductase (Na(+)-transporting) subunit F [Rhodospirillaceae bacterium]|nr:NADH:ubiquinone reductase (Na(+)-transporting) subunit F [Rhodospirillaceae bacterium]
MLSEIILGVAVFTGLIMVLTIIVLAARAILWGNARVRLNINGELVIESLMGSKLLVALEHGGVHLPTSCGGVGTCGLCRVMIKKSVRAGHALPVERSVLSANDVASGYRLACQVVVRGDMEITIPEGILSAENWVCQVLETQTISPLIKEIILSLPAGVTRDLPAGGYVMVEAPAFALKFSDIEIKPEHETTWKRLCLHNLKIENKEKLARAYSLANRPSETDKLVLNIRLALPPGTNPDANPGVVSSYLFGLKPGDNVTVSGPFGNFFINETDSEMIFIGGGVGMAPLCAHVHDQLERVKTKRTISYWYGARSLADLYYANKMERLAKDHENFSWHVALSDPAKQDGWDGDVGFIHKIIYNKYLKTHPNPQNCEYYLCGPPLMIKAVRAMLDKLGIPKENIFYDDFGV